MPYGPDATAPVGNTPLLSFQRLKTTVLLLSLSLFAAVPLCAAAPAKYHLELEANPAAAFPYLGKFGAVTLHVYGSGVRAEALWLNAFSRNGAPAVTVTNPLGRMYVDVPLNDITPTLRKLAGAAVGPERDATPVRIDATRGTVAGVGATRHRLVYSDAAWIDYWTTDAVPQNPQLRAISERLVAGISPGTAAAARKISGTPVYVELNFRRFKKVPLLQLKKVSTTAPDEKDALELGALYVRAGVLEKLLGVR